MRVVLQRVTRAAVRVDDRADSPRNGRERTRTAGEIDAGLLALVGVAEGDQPSDVDRVAAKVAALRIFSDADGRFNESVADIGGAVLVVSQFTLIADVRKGRRPSFTRAARPEAAEPLVERFAQQLEDAGLSVARGVFGAMMEVELVNDGPFTIVIDSDDLDRPRRS